MKDKTNEQSVGRSVGQSDETAKDDKKRGIRNLGERTEAEKENGRNHAREENASSIKKAESNSGVRFVRPRFFAGPDSRPPSLGWSLVSI